MNMQIILTTLTALALKSLVDTSEESEADVYDEKGMDGVLIACNILLVLFFLLWMGGREVKSESQSTDSISSKILKGAGSVKKLAATRKSKNEARDVEMVTQRSSEFGYENPMAKAKGEKTTTTEKRTLTM